MDSLNYQLNSLQINQKKQLLKPSKLKKNMNSIQEIENERIKDSKMKKLVFHVCDI